MRRMTALATVLLLALSGSAAAVDSDPYGTYSGTYRCAQGATALSLSIRPAADGGLSALFYFHAAAGNTAVPSGCFTMTGQWDKQTRWVSLQAGTWLLRPPGYVTVDLEGRLTGNELTGSILGPGCTDFTLHVEANPTAPPPACSPAHAPSGFM